MFFILIFFLASFFSLFIERNQHQLPVCILFAFLLLYFCNFSLQVIKQSFSWKCFVVASKAWLQIFSEKVSKIIPGDKVGKDYDSVWNFFPNFKTFKILQIWTFWPSSHKDPLPANFTKVLSLRILADGICL